MKKRYLWISATLFVAVELLVYYFILFVAGETCRICSFLSIVTAFLFGAMHVCSKRKTLLLNFGLLFTVCADFFLVLYRPQNKDAGMVFFSLAQISYFLFLWLSDENKKQKKVHLIIRLSLIALIETVALVVLGEKADFLSLISVFYFANLATNILFAFLQKQKGLLFAIGLTLFALCDICVGLSVADGIYFTVPEWLHFLVYPPFDLSWFFYLPSQTLIGLYLAISNQKGVSK
jgi:uncharacterized protein (DUF983 family)